MKKILFIIIILFNFNVLASSGTIKQDSIISCDGKYYGSHGSPLHFHEVIKRDGKWVSISDVVSLPSCYIKPVNEKEIVKFSKCVDGDTAKFIINNREEFVRFLAIDTPESVKPNNIIEPYGKEASNYTCNKLKNAKKIELEYDANSDKKDKYERYLAFVFVDDVLLEKELIKNGLAKVAYVYGDYNYVDELRKEEEIAKNNKIGIWSDFLPDEVKFEENNQEENEYLKIINEIIVLIWNIINKIFDFLIN